jgi:hypothetical protein
MNNVTFRLSRITAAACATVITATSAWAFVHASASARDPFQFAAVMAANASVRTVQAESHSTADCWSEHEGMPIRGVTPVCRRG